MALSLDLRQRIVEAYERGEGSQRTLAARFAVGKATVERLIKHKRETGSVAPKVQRHGPLPIVTPEHHALIEAWLAECCDLTQQELADRFTEKTGRRVSQRTMSRVLGRINETRKKSH